MRRDQSNKRQWSPQQREDARHLKIEKYESSAPPSSGLGMLFVILGSLAALFGFRLTRRSAIMNYAFDWLKMQVKYNGIALKEIFFYWFLAKSNMTELPKMPGRVAIVTGGSRGIGAEIVNMLLQCDMDVIIACRKPEAGEKIIKNIRESGVTGGKAVVVRLDNSSLASVKKFVEVFKSKYEKLDILINNAGVMFPAYSETNEGFEEQYGVNYLSHFLLTILLMPLLKNAGSPELNSRIVNVSSCAHLLGNMNFDDVNYKNRAYFPTYEAYAQSKLAQVLFTKSLARLFQEKKLPIQVNAVHPGIVNTDLFNNSYLNYFKPLGRLFFKNAKHGAMPITYAAVSPDMESRSGLYISNCLEAKPNPLVYDKTLQDQLFELSLKQVGIQNVSL